MGGATPLIPVGRSVGPAIVPSTQVSSPQSYVMRSSGGRFARSLAAAQCRWRSLANYEYSSIGRYGTLWLAASYKLQYYAYESCNTCASLAGLVVSFIATVIGVLTPRKMVSACTLFFARDVTHKNKRSHGKDHCVFNSVNLLVAATQLDCSTCCCICLSQCHCSGSSYCTALCRPKSYRPGHRRRSSVNFVGGAIHFCQKKMSNIF